MTELEHQRSEQEPRSHRIVKVLSVIGIALIVMGFLTGLLFLGWIYFLFTRLLRKTQARVAGNY